MPISSRSPSRAGRPTREGAIAAAIIGSDCPDLLRRAPVSYCFNPTCTAPQNPATATCCETCGSSLRLKDRYRALQPLGQGGFGRTFRGCDEHLPGQPACAIKQLYCAQIPGSAIAKAKSLFAQEAVRLSELGEHPQIPTLMAYFDQDDEFYLVQELIDGEPLVPSRWQARDNLETQLWRLLHDLLPVLEYIHDRQVIHRDIKPENIIQRASDGRLVLIDFGIARVLTETALIGNATLVGTPGYMAPEQMRGKVLPASDLYSLGATCLNLLTGANPNDLFDAIDERWQWRDRLPAGTQLSPKAIAVLNQLIAPSLRQRAQSARAVLRELGNPPPPPPPAVETPATRRPLSQALASADEPTRAIASPPVSTSAPTAPTTQPEPPDPHLEEANPLAACDWQPLIEALKRQRWQAADELTGDLLCELAGRPTGSYLPNGELAKLPCEALQILDRLWVKSSQGRFGLSVQAQLYLEVGEQYPLFCDRVGWPVHSPRNHNYLQFNRRRAPRGHLPSRRWLGGVSVWQHMGFLVARLRACELV